MVQFTPDTRYQPPAPPQAASPSAGRVPKPGNAAMRLSPEQQPKAAAPTPTAEAPRKAAQRKEA